MVAVDRAEPALQVPHVTHRASALAEAVLQNVRTNSAVITVAVDRAEPVLLEKLVIALEFAWMSVLLRVAVNSAAATAVTVRAVLARRTRRVKPPESA